MVCNQKNNVFAVCNNACLILFIRSLNRPVDDSDREFLYSELCGLGTYTGILVVKATYLVYVKCIIMFILC